MKRIFVALFLQMVLSCNNNNHPQHSANQHNTSSTKENEKNELTENKIIAVAPNDILRNFDSWYNYAYWNTPLSKSFIGLDVDSTKLDKTNFLNKLINGEYVVFKKGVFRDKVIYQLFKYDGSDEVIKSNMKQLASIEMKNFKMEGQQIPEFNLTDLKGNSYDAASTKGKILVLKCWFIGCTACVKEFPECNNLVNEYKSKSDVLFVSLASDKEEQLKDFLKNKVLEYAVIPKMDTYMVSKLHIDMYPTHLLVDGKGKILKVANTIKELKPFLEKEVGNRYNKAYAGNRSVH